MAAEPASENDTATTHSPGNTEPAHVPMSRMRRRRLMRRLFFVAVCVVLAMALLNVFGVRTSEVSASGGGYHLTVTYASVSRPGLATPWSVEVRRQGGFDGPVTLATTSTYFDVFDENGLDPDPSTATADSERVIWEFEPPVAGDTLTVSFDARIEPGAQLRSVPGTTEVLEDGAPVASVRYKTWLMP